MPGNKYVSNSAGELVEVVSLQASAGAGDAGKIPALDVNGRLDVTMMPSGVGAENAVITASEALNAGDFVNVYNNAGTPNCRKADATNPAKKANGFVTAAVASAGAATVYTDGKNTAVTGLTAGDVFLSAVTPGGVAATAPSASGQIAQKLGVAVSATVINSNFGPAIQIA